MGIFDRFRTSPQEREARLDRQRQSNVARADLDAQAAKRRRGVDATFSSSPKHTLYRDEYMSRDMEIASLVLDADELPTGRLVKELDRLVIRTPKGIVNPKSTHTHRLGIYSFTIRGTAHYGNAPKAGNFRPGAAVRLSREPDNPYDPNAIAIYAWGARTKSGFVNKLNAKRLAPRLDRGDDLVAISTRGSGPGSDEHVPQILVCERHMMEHLLRETSIIVPE